MSKLGIIPWQGVPDAIRWPCVFWFVICVLAIVELGISVFLYIRSPVVGMGNLLLIGGILEICLIGFILFTLYKLMLGARWARIALEIVSWIGLAGIMFDLIVLIASALFNWGEFSADLAKQIPQISTAIKIAAMFILLSVVAGILALIVRALRSEPSVRHVSTVNPHQ